MNTRTERSRLIKKLDQGCWNVWIDSTEIKAFNIFTISKFKEDLVDAVLSTKSEDDFEQHVDKILRYWFNSRSEFELRLTSNPAYLNKSEALSLYEQINADELTVRTVVHLSYSKKLSVYEQIQLNFKVFLNYIKSLII